MVMPAEVTKRYVLIIKYLDCSQRYICVDNQWNIANRYAQDNFCPVGIFLRESDIKNILEDKQAQTDKFNQCLGYGYERCTNNSGLEIKERGNNEK